MSTLLHKEISPRRPLTVSSMVIRPVTLIPLGGEASDTNTIYSSSAERPLTRAESRHSIHITTRISSPPRTLRLPPATMSRNNQMLTPGPTSTSRTPKLSAFNRKQIRPSSASANLQVDILQ